MRRFGGIVKRIVLFAVCAIAATGAAAQWHYLSGGKLSGISSVGSFVWAVGQDGLMFYSEDNGQYWRRVPRFTTRNLVDVEFWDQGFGLITAEGDMLYRTTDDGATWDSSYVQYIGGHIRFITHDCIWVTGLSNGRILRSMDGGLSWPVSRQYAPSAWFLDSLNGWSTGPPGNGVRVTTDAGQNWTQIGEVPVPFFSGSINCFGFNGPETGICAWASVSGGREPITAYGWSSTNNGGASWSDLAYGTSGVVCDIGQDGRVYGLEANGVVIWGPLVNSRFGVSRFQGFQDISAARGDRAWICGDGGAIWSSLDSGVSWTPVKPQSGISLGNVDFTDSLHGWGVSSHWAARTTDGGRSWIPAATGGLPWISDVVALGESTCVTAAGWTVGDMVHGYSGEFGLERTVNAGASWDTIHFTELGYNDVPIGPSRFSHIGRHIWHAGTRTPDGNSLSSSDDGATWLDMDTVCTTGEGEPPDISFVDTLHGWVIDSRRNVRVTDNSGDSWTIIATGLNVKRLKMTSLTNGWAISDSELFETTDGGVTWDGGVVHSGLQAIAFCDSTHGAIVGLKGLILRTSDAGQTWVWDESEFTSDLHDVCMLDSTHAWAVGGNGLVLGFGDWAIGVDEARGHEGTRIFAAAVAVRPNPCRARAIVEFSTPLARPMQVTLVDVVGRVMQAVPVQAGVRSLELDLRGTPSGVYFIRVGSGPAARLVVQR
jgi:photosystem II stability/assembly factor-like uncharacterized protein